MIKKIKTILKMVSFHERRLVLHNFLSLSTLQAINYVLPLLLLPYLIRVIGPEKFGLIAFAQAFVQYFLILTDYGFNLSATREIALCKEKNDKVCAIFSSVMTVKIALAVISCVLLLLIVRFIPRFRHDWLVFVLSFGIVIGNTLFPVWYYQGTERMRHIAKLNIIAGLIITALIFIFVSSPEDYLRIPVIYSGVSIITGIIGLRMVFRKFGVFFVFQAYPDIRQQIKSGWNIFSSIVAINAYTATRIFAVGLLTNNMFTGYYSIAERMAQIVQMFPLASLTQALYPRLSKIYQRNRKKAWELMLRIQQVTTGISSVSIPLIYVCAGLITGWICGKPYPEVILTFRLLLLSVLFVAANAFKVQFLLVCGKTRNYARIHITAALFGLPLIFGCIYAFSWLGAACATVIIEGGIFFWTSRVIHRLAPAQFKTV
ncbi:MAG TPA: flippase [Candidatus Omnitrophota bacterium]|nr:flippase [Candidatus Omnitrophota bacterium]HRZ14727.1 flippase [Candidatus Omnitrophota bacterium]